MNQSRAQWVRDIENGALVTLDFKCTKEVFQQKIGLSTVHLAGAAPQKDPPLASVYLTPDMCKELGCKAMHMLEGVYMHLPIHRDMSKGGYEHATLLVKMQKGVLVFELKFVPQASLTDKPAFGGRGEEGEVNYPEVMRRWVHRRQSYVVCH